MNPIHKTPFSQHTLMTTNVPTQPTQMTPKEPYDLFFTGRDDPRHGSIMMGYVGVDIRPVYYSFDTPDTPEETRTTVSSPGSFERYIHLTTPRCLQLPLLPGLR